MFKKFLKNILIKTKPFRTTTLTVVLISLGFLVFFENKFFQFRMTEKEKNLKIRYIEKADSVFSYNEKKKQEALANAKKHALLIESELLKAYDYDVDKLVSDAKGLVDRKYNSCLISIVINNIIDGKTLNNVPTNKKDRNDFIVILANLIINDLSDDCATDTPIRTLLEESQNQFVPKLALAALSDITLLGKDSTFWHFKHIPLTSPYYNLIKSFETTDINFLKTKFIETGGDMSFLENFEFLAISSTDDRVDIAGIPFLFPNGTRNKTSLQFHVIQGYNLIDQIELDPSYQLELKALDSAIAEAQNQLDREKFLNDLSFAITFLIFFVLYVVALKDEKKSIN